MRAFLLLVVTLAVGGGIGYLFGMSRSDGSRPRQAPRRTGASASAPAGVRPRGDSDLARALRALPLPRVSLGTGRIRGTVRDEEGNGVSGVTVRAFRVFERQPRPDDGSPPKTPDLEAAVAEFVHDSQRREMTTVEAVTKPDGTYMVEGLAKAEYTVQAYLVDHEVRRAGPDAARRVRPGATVDWIARSVASVRVDVFLPAGERPDTAWIRCRRDGETTTRAWNPRQPEIRLPPGRYTLTATAHDGPEEYKSESTAHDIAPGRNEGTVVFRLRGRPGIRGEIHFPDGVRFRNVRVYALRFAGAAPPSEEQLTKRGKEAYVWASQDSSYAFQDLPPGRYLVGVGARPGAVFRTETVEVHNRTETCDLEVTDLDPEDYVVLRVYGPTGKAVKEVDLDTAYETSHGSSSGGGVWARRADGAFLVFHHEHDHEEGGTYRIEAETDAYGSKRVSYKLGEVHELEIRFGPPAQVQITVEGFATHPHAASISFGLSRKGEDEGRFDNKAPDGTGVLTLGPVEAGEYELVTYVSQERYERVVAERQPLTLQPGENLISVGIPRLYPLTILAPPRAQLHLSRLDDPESGRIGRTCDENGRASFPALAAGRYQILSWGSSGGQMEVTLPGPAEVAFKPGKLDALRVKITDPDGTIAKAGFQDGDLVIAIDGSEFENLNQLQMLMAVAMGKETVTFTVLRGGRSFQLAVEIQDMMRGNQGGRLDPGKR